MNTVAMRPAAERRFYLLAALGIVAVVLAGFSIDVGLLRDMSSLSALVRLHGALMLGWIALFLTQTVLVARHRTDWHRRLGILGALLAAAIVITATPTVIVAARLGGEHVPPGIAIPVFVARALFDLLSFTLLVSGALALRRLSDWHKRLMLLAALLLLDAALARFIGAYTSWTIDASLARNLMVLTAVAIDTVRYRRLHPAFLLGASLLFATDPVATWLAGTPAWARFYAGLL